MAKIGYFISCEETSAPDSVARAARAEQAGFECLWVSDHFHPWNDEQGESPLVWAVLGGIAQVTERVHVTTGVTCPTMRIHPAITAQAAATVATMMPGRFSLGVGTGEALNEAILGDAWPEANVRLKMLEEAIEVMRALFTGEVVHHRGTHYKVEHARLYSLPAEPVPILVSGFGAKAVSLAARVGDGYMNVAPEAEKVEQYRAEGGTGPAHMGSKVCWADTEEQGTQTAHRLWANQGLPGELAQILPTPEHFMQGQALVTPEMIGSSMVTGPDVERHVANIQEGIDAGYDEIYVSQIGAEQEGFFELYEREVLPRFR